MVCVTLASLSPSPSLRRLDWPCFSTFNKGPPFITKNNLPPNPQEARSHPLRTALLSAHSPGGKLYILKSVGKNGQPSIASVYVLTPDTNFQKVYTDTPEFCQGLSAPMHMAVFGVVPHFHSGFSLSCSFTLLCPSSHVATGTCAFVIIWWASAPKLCSLCQTVSGKHLWKIEIPYTRNSGQGREGKTHNPPGEPKHSLPPRVHLCPGRMGEGGCGRGFQRKQTCRTLAANNWVLYPAVNGGNCELKTTEQEGQSSSS